MYFKLSDVQIRAIREKTFPNINNFSIISTILKTSGTDIIADIDFQVKDSVITPKVFNIADKSILKLKVFQIINDKMREELIPATNIFVINEIIKRYGAEVNDLAASLDFLGNKTDITEHFVVEDEILLLYKSKFAMPDENLQFLSFGIIFYKDITSNIDANSVVPETLSTNLKIIDLLDNNGKILDTSVQDLRAVNKIFQNNGFLENLNEKVTLDFKFTKQLSQKTPKKDKDFFFSTPYFSKSQNGNLNLTFNLDFKNLVQSNSVFAKILKNTKFTGDLQEKVKISSIKIIRKRFEVNKRLKNKNPTPTSSPTLTVIDSSQTTSNSNNVVYKDTEDGSILERKLFEDFRTFDITDKKIYKNRASSFRYGVQLTVNDGYPEYLGELRDLLLTNLQVLESYYQETNNFVKPASKNPNKKELTIGYYDQIIQSFTRRFVTNIYPVLYQDKINETVSIFLNILDVFGIFANEEEASAYRSSILAMLSPSVASGDTIIYFIKSYERVIHQINRILKENTNTVFDIEHWFSSELVDASENPKIGYSFFDVTPISGSLVIKDTDLENKVANDVEKYTFDNKLPSDKEEYRFSYISPSIVNSIEKQLSLMKLEDLSNFDYSDLEMDIKNYNSLDYSSTQPILSEDISAMPKEKQKYKMKAESLFNKLSFTTSNMFSNTSDASLIKKHGAAVLAEPNDGIDPNYLFRRLIKNTSKKAYFSREGSVRERNVDGILFLNKDQVLSKETPFHIESLYKKADKEFSPSSIKYLSDLDHHPQFLFMYNTIHAIEILRYGDNIRDEKWQLLTKTVYNSILKDENYFCRLRLFQDSSLKINSFDEISLPIYNEYFILHKTASSIAETTVVRRKAIKFIEAVVATVSQINTFQEAKILQTPLNIQSDIPPTLVEIIRQIESPRAADTIKIQENKKLNMFKLPEEPKAEQQQAPPTLVETIRQVEAPRASGTIKIQENKKLDIFKLPEEPKAEKPRIAVFSDSNSTGILTAAIQKKLVIVDEKKFDDTSKKEDIPSRTKKKKAEKPVPPPPPPPEPAKTEPKKDPLRRDKGIKKLEK